MIEEYPFWWCDSCDKNVHVLHSPGQGQYCQLCGKKTRIPDKEMKQNILFEDVFDDTVIDIDLIKEDLDSLGKIRFNKRNKKYNHDEETEDLDD